MKLFIVNSETELNLDMAKVLEVIKSPCLVHLSSCENYPKLTQNIWIHLMSITLRSRSGYILLWSLKLSIQVWKNIMIVQVELGLKVKCTRLKTRKIELVCCSSLPGLIKSSSKFKAACVSCHSLSWTASVSIDYFLYELNPIYQES